ncbi:MAG: hypothetical protein ACI9LV_001002, partial [Candidatus Nanohaloarchaea archaeon]
AFIRYVGGPNYGHFSFSQAYSLSDHVEQY